MPSADQTCAPPSRSNQYQASTRKPGSQRPTPMPSQALQDSPLACSPLTFGLCAPPYSNPLTGCLAPTSRSLPSHPLSPPPSPAPPSPAGSPPALASSLPSRRLPLSPTLTQALLASPASLGGSGRERGVAGLPGLSSPPCHPPPPLLAASTAWGSQSQGS